MDFETLSVMVVEDHDFQRRMAVQILKSLGVVRLSEASDGHSALELLRASPDKPDIIISDLDMPGMDGIEFIRHVAEDRLAHAVSIASALDSAMLHSVETMAKAYGLQVLGVMAKPLTARRMTELLGYYQGQVTHMRAPGVAAAITADALRAALAQGLIVAHYQPQIDLHTGRCCGVEALARWLPPGHAAISPGAFMPVVERENLVDELTSVMLQHSCQAQKMWETQGLRLRVSVNLSMSSVTNVDFANRLLDIVRAADGDPRQITLEVTESAVMKDAARGLDVLTRLRLRGFGLSIDDFGTGYSSMQQLSSIPFSELKIDQSFVHGAVQEPRKRTMVETSLELARKLKLRTVAEGAETRAEWDLLIGLGCDEVQGWFIAKAMPAEELNAWVRAWRPPGS